MALPDAAASDVVGAALTAPEPPGAVSEHEAGSNGVSTALHVAFVKQLYHVKPGSLAYTLTSHLRLNAVYWACVTLWCLGRLSLPQSADSTAACSVDEQTHDQEARTAPSTKQQSRAGDTQHIDENHDTGAAPRGSISVAAETPAPEASRLDTGVDMRTEEVLPREELIAEVLSCRDRSPISDGGGFGAAEGHDPHIVPTLHAVQLLAMHGALYRLVPDDKRQSAKALDDAVESSKAMRRLLDVELGKIARYVGSLQIRRQLPSDQAAGETYTEAGDVDEDEIGAIAGDKWGEVDNRLNYAAVQALVLIDRLDVIDAPALRQFVARCRNFDGGYGGVPGGESHAAHCFTALGTLALLNARRCDENAGTDESKGSRVELPADSCPVTGLSRAEREQTAWWLSLRQLKNGGLNGRPEKLEDVCYSWWVLSSLDMLDRLHWIDGAALRGFVLSTQDTQDGGFSDRPGDEPDINHTCFALTGLALLGTEGINRVDSRFCLPVPTVRALGIRPRD